MTFQNLADEKISAQSTGGRATEIESVTPRILLADDQKEILRTVGLLLEKEFEILGSALDGEEALDLALNWCPDVLVLDIFMPGLNGLETAARLKTFRCPTKVLFLTVQEDLDFVETAMSVGALGYVLKPHLHTDLIPAIHSVLEGQVYISPSMHLSWPQG